MESSSSDQCKCVLIGDTGVGKTCIATRFISNTFSMSSPSTLSASFLKRQLNQVWLQLWDSAGQERFRSIASLYYRGAFAIVLVFDLTRKASFESLQYWINDIDSKYNSNKRPLLYFAGNKYDLNEQREVTDEEINQMVTEQGGVYFEVSALSGKNVLELFEDIAGKFEERGQASSPPKKVAVQEIRTDKKGCCFE